MAHGVLNTADNVMYNIEEVDRVYYSDVLVWDRNVEPVDDIIDVYLNNLYTTTAVTNVDRDLLLNYYSNLNEFIKTQSETILLPSEGYSATGPAGEIYGFDSITGDLVKFVFNRTTNGTAIDRDGNFKNYSSKTPRIDYLNGGGILMEKASTNLFIRNNYLVSGGTPVFTTSNGTYGTAYNYKGRPYQPFSKTADGSGSSISIRQSTLTNGSKYAVRTFTKGFTLETETNKKYRQYQNFDLSVTADVKQGTATYATSTGVMTFADTEQNILDVFYTKDNNTATPEMTPYFPTATNAGSRVDIGMGYQIELGTECTSSIICNGASTTRSQDTMSITLNNNCSVYIASNKGKRVLDKSSGMWNIENDMNNESVRTIAIFKRVLTTEEKNNILS